MRVEHDEVGADPPHVAGQPLDGLGERRLLRGEQPAPDTQPPADPEREAVQIARLRALSETSGLDPHFAEKFLNVIIAEVIQNHRQFLDE